MELPHGNHKPVQFGWLQALADRKSATQVRLERPPVLENVAPLAKAR